MPYPRLFSPLALAGRTLRNRLCLTATVTNFARAGRITEAYKDFLVERAKGGTAMLVTEVVAVDPEAVAQSAIVAGFDDANEGGFRDLAARVAAEGSLLVGQLWHPGKQQLWHPTRAPMGVSDQPDAYSWTVPHVMSTAEVRRVARAYVATASRLAGYGLAGVELHGAHGYLISQFLSPWSNWRDDAYGGSREGRCQFVIEVARGIREACGSGFVLGLKMPGDEGVPGGIDPDEAAAITRHLAATGLFDYFAYGQGNFSLSLESHVPDLHFRPGHFLAIHRRMREAAGGVPVMALGKIGTPELAEQVVAEGSGDLVGMSRALISDAAFAEKALTGRAADIRPCVFDNFAWGEIHAGKPLAEAHNPWLGRAGEAAARLEPAPRPRRVAVVGAGPGGLEAAWTAAARGHEVTLYGASPEPGGALRLEAALPGRGDVLKVIDWQARMAERHGVTLRLGTIATEAEIRAAGAEALVLATGAAERWPETLAPGAAPAMASRDYVAAGDMAPTDPASRVVLFDMDHSPFVYAVADLLAARFRQVVLLTPRPRLAQGVNHCSAIGVHRRLYAAEAEIVLAGEPLDCRDGRVTWRNVYTGRTREIDDVALLVYATPRTARDGLARALADLSPRLVGDCQSPRNLLAAIHGGHAVAAGL